MRLVFLGSGRFAVPSLEALLAGGHEVAAVVTQPDRPTGRGRALAPPPVKPVALDRGLALLQPERVRHQDAVERLRALVPEVQVVVAYGQVLPRAVIDLAPRGTVNVHASLLPRYRGAAPVQWAIANGETETGVTTMLIDEGLDTGPVLLQRATPIGPEETADALEARLATMGADLLLETLAGLERGTLTPVPQDAARATHAPLLRKSDGQMTWGTPADLLERRVRGFHPWPGVTVPGRGAPLKLLRARIGPRRTDAAPGTVLAVAPEGVDVACGAGTVLRLLEVQPESRKAMPAAALAAGARLRAGDVLS